MNITHEEAKEFMHTKFIGHLNADDVYDTFDTIYDTIQCRKIKNAVRNEPIDHFIHVSKSHIVGISLIYGSVFTFTFIDDFVNVTCDQRAFTNLASYYINKK